MEEKTFLNERGVTVKHIVVTPSASGASKGYTSKDGVFVARVVDALNNAIISRG